MKKLWLLMAALIAGSSLAVPTAAADSGADLLESADVYITFEDNSIEDVNQNYNVFSDGETPIVEGKFGTAGNVTSAINFITVENLKFGTDSFTVATWLKIDEHKGDPVLFGNKDWDSGSNEGWLLCVQNDSFKLNANVLGGSRTDTTYPFSTAAIESSMGEWYHLAIAVDRDAQTYTVYINGLPVSTTDFSDKNHAGGAWDDTTNQYHFNIGEGGNGFYNMTQTLVANYDEFAIFKKLLTEEQIQSIYTYAPEGYEPAVLQEKVDYSAPLVFESDPAEVVKSANVYIDFDDGIVDSRGRYTITQNGETPLIEGKFGQAANFKNAVNYLTINNYSLGTDSYTISAWVNLHLIDGDPVLFGNKDWDSGSNPGIVIVAKEDLFRYSANAESGARIDSDYPFSGSPITEAYDTWNHIAVSVDRDAQTITTYLNGRQYGKPVDFSDKGHAGLSYDVNVFNIGEDGASKYNQGEGLDFDLDEFAIFKKALTADEVAAVYSYENPLTPEEPAADEPETAAEEEEPVIEETEAPADETEAPADSEPVETIEETETPADDAEAPADDKAEGGNTGVIVGVVVAVVAVAAVVCGILAAKKKKK